MNAPVFCTILRKSQLAHGRVLAASLRRHHPRRPLWALLSDEPEGFFDPAREAWDWVRTEELRIPWLSRLRSGCGAEELAGALKPPFLARLLERAPSLVYLDPETLVLAPLTRLDAALRRSQILFSPQLLAPLEEDGRLPDELTFLERGAYNPGFLGLRRSASARRFLEWWGARAVRYAGSSLDQRWFDLAPGLFEGVGILTDPAYGAGAAGRGVERGARLFQFKRADAGRREAPRSLLKRYRRLLRDHGSAQASRWPYTWAGRAR